jgi:hypothetical protein
MEVPPSWVSVEVATGTSVTRVTRVNKVCKRFYKETRQVNYNQRSLKS